MEMLYINVKWQYFIKFIRFIRGSNKCPKFIYKLSKKYFGTRDDLARYWLYKYNNIYIGKYTYGYTQLLYTYIKKVGSFTSIASGVSIATNTHNYNFVTTSPILFDKKYKFPCKENILSSYCPNLYHSVEIGNDVWIGANVTIFNGVKIGDGAVIAAGSIIRNDVPPYAIVVGVDRIIKYRFKQDEREKLLKIKWWEWDETKIKEKVNEFYKIDEFLGKYN